MIKSTTLKDFSEDLFQREEIADDLTRFIGTAIPAVNDNSLVIGLDSSFGTGKSSFINMWRNKLENPKAGATSYHTIIYNAWEHDDCSEAIIPLICSFNDLLHLSAERRANIETLIQSLLKSFVPGLVKALMKIAFNIDASAAIDTLKECVTTLPETMYEEYSSLEEKKKKLKEFVTEITSDGKPLLLFIDELDRCRPTFAIETLEAVKHFFDLENVVFVFSVDMLQLQKSVENIYGEINSMGYLQRFFDYQFCLPKPTNYEVYMGSILQYDGVSFEDEIAYLENLRETWNLSLRELTVICKAYLKFYLIRYHGRENILEAVRDRRFFFLYFIAKKYHDFNGYLREVRNGVEFTDEVNYVIRELLGSYAKRPIDRISIYTREIANTSLYYLLDPIWDHKLEEREKQAKQLFIPEDKNPLISMDSSYAVAEAVMNIVDYGFAYSPKLSEKNDKN